MVGETNIIADKYQSLDDGTNKGNFIHGSAIHNGYVYGTPRGNPPNPSCLVKALVSDVSQFTLIPILVPGNNPYYMDNLVIIGDYLYTLAVLNGNVSSHAVVIKYDLIGGDYQVYSVLMNNATGCPSCTDGTYWYVQGGGSIFKINPEIFNSSEKYNISENWPLTGIISCSVGSYLGYTHNAHTMVVDDTHLYVGYGGGGSDDEYDVQKILKSDMTHVSYALTPKMTDDMCQTNTHVFCGIELFHRDNVDSYGYGWGTFSVRKSDMVVTKIPKLHSTDTADVSSYASLIFGNYLVDCKTNCYIYVIDISDVDNWLLSEDIGGRTLKAYKMIMPNGVNTFYQPVNELMLDDNGVFVGFNWGLTSAVSSFDLTGLDYFSPPALSSDDSVVVDDIDVSLSGTVVTTGNKAITECGIEFGQAPDLSDSTIYSITPITNEFEKAINDLPSGVYYWRSYAINELGTGYGDIKSFEIKNPFEPANPPENLQSEVVSVLTLNWEEPFLGSAVLTGYKIESKTETGNWGILENSYQELSYSAEIYEKTYFRISAITAEIGDGGPTEPINISPLTGGGGLVNVPYKIYFGSQEIVSSGIDISDADASVGEVLDTKTFYATSGGKKTGTMPDNGTVSTDISTAATEVTIAAGKHSGSGVVKISAAEQAKIIADNIKKDIVILGITGTVESDGGGATSGDYKVRFIDFDGTILKTEWVNSGQNATAPSNPTHTYLTFNSWNIDYTNVTRNLDVGATYSTTDGKSYLFIRVSPTTGLAPTLYLQKSDTATMTVDWGDSATSTNSSSGNITMNHTYSVEGDYIATIACSGVYTFGQGTNSTQIFIGNYVNITKSIYIGSSITIISNYGFYSCRALTSITIPSGVTSIGVSAFTYGYALVSVTIPSGVTSIGANTFQNCYSLVSVTIPSSVTSMGTFVFHSCFALTSIIIPPSVTTLGANLLYYCYSLASISIPSGVTSIGDSVFQNCYSLLSITIPSSVTTIGASAFSYCSVLTSIIIPSGVTTIGANTFSYCYALVSVIIPSSVTTIGTNAFYNCYSLKDYQINATTPPTLTSGALGGLSMITKIYVPDASVSAYKAATDWITYANYIYPISTRP